MELALTCSSPEAKTKPFPLALSVKAMLRQNSAERLPVPRILQIRKAGTLYPAGERLYVPRPLHVDGPRWAGPVFGTYDCPRLVRIAVQPPCDTGQFLMIIERLMNMSAFRMNLLMGDVQMEMFRVAVQDGHALVTSIAKTFAKTAARSLQSRRERMLPFLKADHTVVGLIALCPSVLLLDGQPFPCSPM